MFLIRPPVPPVSAQRAAWVFVPCTVAISGGFSHCRRPASRGPGVDLHFVPLHVAVLLSLICRCGCSSFFHFYLLQSLNRGD